MSAKVDLTLVWAAGFFDGEGHVTIAVAKRSNGRLEYSLEVGFTNTRVKPLIEIRKKFGARIVMQGAQPLQNRPCYSALMTGNKAMLFLEKALPYLRVKHRDALVGIEFQKTKHYQDGMNRTPQHIQDYRQRLKDELIKIHGRKKK